MMGRHLRITGMVQGVGYRAAFASQAHALNLSGWVRNRLDGSVEAVVHGDAQSVDRIIAWARRGPPGSRVTGVTVDDEADSGGLTQGFAILPTA